MKFVCLLLSWVVFIIAITALDMTMTKLNHIEKISLQTQLLLEEFNPKYYPTLQDGGIVRFPNGAMLKFSTFSNTWLEVKQGFTAANSSTNSTGWHTPCGGSFSPFK